jgi:Cu2+-exporting ATPase
MANLKKENYPVINMTCTGCAANVQKALKKHRGVKTANVNFANRTVTVEYDPSATTPENMREAVRSAGYTMIVDDKISGEDDGDDPAEKPPDAVRLQYRRTTVRTVAAGIASAMLVALSMTPLMHAKASGYAAGALATFVLVACGLPFFAGAYRQARHRSANMDTLVAMSTATAYLFSLFNLLSPDAAQHGELGAGLYFETSAVIIFFILLGKLLEERARRKTTAAVRKLMSLQVKTATLVDGDGYDREVRIADIRVGDVLLAKSGERMAVDGNVVAGHSFVDESMISGEPLPVEKNAGDAVYAGTVNRHGSFRYRAAKVGRATLLAQIVRMVEDAQNSRAPIQKTVDRIAGIFVPAVAGVAVLSAAAWLTFGGEDATAHAVLSFVTVLIVACPCALGLATPTAIMVGMKKGASQGILIKDMDSLETLRKVDTVIMDKTGTVTRGAPSVTDAKWSVTDKAERARLESILSGMEKVSGHPLAKAVTEAMPDAVPMQMPDVELKPGAGISATVGGERFHAGNSRLFPALSSFAPEEDVKWAEARESEGKTTVLFGSDVRLFALFAVSDEIRESSAKAVADLQQAGIEVVMATGDNETSARETARQAGIRTYRANALPEDKLKLIREKQQAGRIVAMVGDGINDSAALAQADVSMAMGKGSDIALEVASITLISGDLGKICAAVRLSRNTVATIRQNLFWAFVYNIVSIPVAAGIFYPVNGFVLDPMIAGAAMSLSSVSVVMNSLRFNGLK